MKWISQAALLLLVAAIVGVGVYLFTNRGGSNDKTIVTVDQIKKVAQLATMDYHISVTQYYEKQPVGLEWLPAQVYVSVSGHIIGSVDMALAQISLPKEDGDKRVSIVFPTGAVLVSDPQIGENDIQLMTCANPNPFHPLNDKDFQAAQKMAIKKLKDTANADGIRQKTATEAKAVLENFLMALGHEADVTFEEKALQPSGSN